MLRAKRRLRLIHAKVRSTLQRAKTSKPAASERFTMRTAMPPCVTRRAPSSFRHIEPREAGHQKTVRVPFGCRSVAILSSEA